ncbi:hypothetical protein LL033_14515 [Clostridium estertheticum]|uniref:hypothetical protein n=1 Tax=Clostridium estertheticum TaxID=238834 RepID=UPI001C0AA67B|nr:hypothetical protein [Clostridium estertheticum]MBU3218149.1 hypothetical protein [Clostridium estertheticum]WAG53864.1 hypothetical protein LL033_14515 [Clostridium estertheticum]
MKSKRIKIKLMTGILLASMAISTSNIAFAANTVTGTKLGAVTTEAITSTQNTVAHTALSSTIPNEEETSVIATVKAAPFGAIINATSIKKEATKYQVFDGTKIISTIANLGTNTTIFPGKSVGDVVTIKLLNAAGTIVSTINVTLIS